MADSTKWRLVGWGIFLLSGVAIYREAGDLKVATLHIVTAIALATAAILRALGK